MEKTKNTDIFENMPVPNALAAMAVPTIMGQLMVLIYSLADTFYVGKTNNPYMVAGASLILPVFNICISLAGLSGVGGGSLISRLLGKHDYEEAKKVSLFSILLSLVLALTFSLLMLIFMEPVLSVLGAGTETYNFAKQYAFCVIVLGAAPTVLSNTLSNLLRSVGESKKAGFGVTFGGLINIVLDPIFMFVILPDGMEIAGAGIATFLSNCITCIYFYIMIKGLGKDSVLSCKLSLGLPRKDSIRSVFTVGFPSAFATLLFDLDYVVIDKLMSAYGDIALAAVGIVLKAERLPLNVGIGICQGMVPMVAYNYSAKNYKRMRDIINFARLSGIVFAVSSVVMYELFAPFIMHLFINNADTIQLGTNFLRVRTIATPLMFLSFFTVYLFNSFGRGDRALFLGVMRWLVFNIPMLFILNFALGMYGIVWSQFTADILTVTLSFIVYFKFEKTLNIGK